MTPKGAYLRRASGCSFRARLRRGYRALAGSTGRRVNANLLQPFLEQGRLLSVCAQADSAEGAQAYGVFRRRAPPLSCAELNLRLMPSCTVEPDPRATRLMLIDSMSGSLSVRQQVRWAERLLQSKLRQGFESGVKRSATFPVVSEGIFNGLAYVARGWLLDGHRLGGQLSESRDDLQGWARVYGSQAIRLEREVRNPPYSTLV